MNFYDILIDSMNWSCMTVYKKIAIFHYFFTFFRGVRQHPRAIPEIKQKNTSWPQMQPSSLKLG